MNYSANQTQRLNIQFGLIQTEQPRRDGGSKYNDYELVVKCTTNNQTKEAKELLNKVGQSLGKKVKSDKSEFSIKLPMIDEDLYGEIDENLYREKPFLGAKSKHKITQTVGENELDKSVSNKVVFHRRQLKNNFIALFSESFPEAIKIDTDENGSNKITVYRNAFLKNDLLKKTQTVKAVKEDDTVKTVKTYVLPYEIKFDARQALQDLQDLQDLKVQGTLRTLNRLAVKNIIDDLGFEINKSSKTLNKPYRSYFKKHPLPSILAVGFALGYVSMTGYFAASGGVPDSIAMQATWAGLLVVAAIFATVAFAGFKSYQKDFQACQKQIESFNKNFSNDNQKDNELGLSSLKSKVLGSAQSVNQSFEKLGVDPNPKIKNDIERLSSSSPDEPKTKSPASVNVSSKS